MNLLSVYRHGVSCDFCAQQFASVAEKNAHTLDHFERQMCQDCNQNLLRIGDNFYIVHATLTCIRHTEIKYEHETDEVNLNALSAIEVHPIDAQQYDDDIIKTENVNDSFEQLDTIRLATTVMHIDTCISIPMHGSSEIIPQSINNAPNIEETANRHQQFSCTYDRCDAMLTRASHKLHIASVHAENCYECDACKIVFTNRSELCRHIVSHDVISCSRCGSTNLTEAAFMRHHQKPNFMCRECGLTFCKFSQLKTHYKQHPGADPNSAIDLVSKLSIEQVRARKKIKKHRCDICQKIFATLFEIRAHMNVHGAKVDRSHKCVVCGKSNLSKSSWWRHHSKQNVACNWCDRRFCTRTNLNQHRLDDHCGPEIPASQAIANKTLKRFKCKVEGCNELISTNSRSYHMKMKHTLRSKQFQCDICGKCFAAKSTIHYHILRMHVPSSKKFKCTLCGKAYLTQGILDWHHKKSHIKEKSFMVKSKLIYISFDRIDFGILIFFFCFFSV